MKDNSELSMINDQVNPLLLKLQQVGSPYYDQLAEYKAVLEAIILVD